MATLTDHWETLDGLALSQGLEDLRDLPFARVANYVYHFLTKNGDERGVQKIVAALWRPPVGEEPDARSPWSAENETKALASFGAAIGAGPPTQSPA